MSQNLAAENAATFLTSKYQETEMNEKHVRLQCEIARFEISGISAKRNWSTDQNNIADNTWFRADRYRISGNSFIS